MLTPELVKPLILHEDKFVRDAALRYFHDSFSTDPDLLALAFEGWSHYGERGFLPAAGNEWLEIERFRLTEASLEQLLDHLATAEVAANVRLLSGMLARAPLELITAREQAILEHPRLLSNDLSRIRRRRELAGWSAERLWEELQDLARRSPDDDEFQGNGPDDAEALVEALARHDVPDEETVRHLLRTLRPEEGSLNVLLVGLAGERRMGGLLPELVDALLLDADELPGCAREALAKIGDPAATLLVRDRYPGVDDRHRFAASVLFETIKHPTSEEALLSTLEAEDDITLRTFLCLGLCELFSERGLEVVLRQIESEYDRSVTSLEDHLLPVFEVLGIGHPKAEEWVRQRAERVRRRAQRQAELERWREGLLKPTAQGSRPAAVEYGPPRAALGEATAPIRRDGPRVGRNDPCPCGSGKKWKKCCGAGRA